MTPGGPSPHRETGMSYGVASANRVTWSASRGAYSQRRLMLWATDTAGAMVEGRRFMPPRGSGGGTQPGRERPHPRTPDPDPRVGSGVAHVPAAGVGNASESRTTSAVTANAIRRAECGTTSPLRNAVDIMRYSR